MKNVVEDVEKNEKDIDEIVLKCYYSMCKYFKKDIKVIKKFTNIYFKRGEN